MPKKIKEGLNTGSLADVKPRKPAVKITRDSVIIRTEWHKEWGGCYDFALDRIDTPEKLLGWVHHLCGKKWFDPLTAREFVEKISDHFGWDIDNL